MTTIYETPKNSKEWSALSSRAVAEMLNGDLKHSAVKEVNNGFGKHIALAKTHVEYQSLRKEKPSVPWLVK